MAHKGKIGHLDIAQAEAVLKHEKREQAAGEGEFSPKAGDRKAPPKKKHRGRVHPVGGIDPGGYR
jgi:hypothetical protein